MRKYRSLHRLDLCTSIDLHQPFLPKMAEYQFPRRSGLCHVYIANTVNTYIFVARPSHISAVVTIYVALYNPDDST